MHYLSIAAFTALSLLAPITAAQSVAAPVAHVFGTSLQCLDLGTDDAASCASALLRYVRMKAAAAFIAQHALNATRAELDRLIEYNRAFERHDRSQRARKLVELEARLGDDSLDANERARLEEFRSILARLAQYEADLEAGIETREPIDENTLRGWIEAAKLNAALYARHGGTVGLSAAGPYAHGAMRTLIIEHMQRGDVRILDPNVEARFLSALEAPPRLLHRDGAPDFTPFWERPIPPSYMPD